MLSDVTPAMGVLKDDALAAAAPHATRMRMLL